jgi:hypothetical protein
MQSHDRVDAEQVVGQSGQDSGTEKMAERKATPSALFFEVPMAGSSESDARSWLTPEQVAAKLGLEVEKIAHWRAQGSGPPWVRVGDEIRYSEADFTRWLGEMIGGS